MKKSEIKLSSLHLKKGMEIIATFHSPNQTNAAILITGESYYSSSINPIIHFYQIIYINSKWQIISKLHSFAFWNFQSAESFTKDIATMSALDLLLLMNSQLLKPDKSISFQ